ncbi:MAG: glucose-6-phosphate isomerase [Saprospiraceae bacterium]|nr:glucose-6-phosphate isomerase [Saprospiraceae bacterium]
MQHIHLDTGQADHFIRPEEYQALAPQALAAAQTLESRNGPGKEFLGWLDLPENYDRAELERIEQAARDIRANSQVLIVIGIGGSYLGAKAALEFCRPSPPLFDPRQASELQIGFAGANLSAPQHHQLLDALGDRDFSINVISKSGTTTEPALAFRLFKKKLEEKYGKAGARARIYATTDRARGALKTLADREGYTTFVVPDDVGGRFSVLTAVGLLPVAAAGIDPRALLRGAADARQRYATTDFESNDVLRYVAARNILHRKGKDIEMLVNYEPRLHFVAEWWKQLFGESEGKDGKGIFTASADFTTDLHSLGQYIQDGKRHLFETLLEIETPEHDLLVEPEPGDPDGLNYLAGKSLDFINKKAAEGTVEAHVSGGVPNLKISIPAATPYQLGQLFYFFEKACAISGYLLGVNPFDQPGVEAYKKNMFRLLGKPG